MNNAKIAYKEETEDKLAFLQKKQGELYQVIEAINGVESTEDWKKLKSLLLDGVVHSLERQLAAEASAPNVDLPKLYRLQGQVAWARRYADLKKLVDFFRQELEGVKKQIKNEQNNPTD